LIQGSISQNVKLVCRNIWPLFHSVIMRKFPLFAGVLLSLFKVLFYELPSLGHLEAK